MKKIKLLIFSLIIVLTLTGCTFNKNTLENANINTTIYPVKYAVSYFYGDNSTVSSIYPDGVNLDEYSLTKKQINKYADSDLFVYVGLGNEKQIAKSLINKNKKLLIIDATYGLSYENDVKELWLAPNNYLMMLKNIKNSLIEYLDNSIKEDKVISAYEELYTDVSWIDAELRSIAKDASKEDNNTIVASSKVFKFLNNYGYNVICLEEVDNDIDKNEILNQFKSSKYNKILVLEGEANSELVNELVEKHNAALVTYNNLITNSDPAKTYTTIQYENIAKIRDIVTN